MGKLAIKDVSSTNSTLISNEDIANMCVQLLYTLESDTGSLKQLFKTELHSVPFVYKGMRTTSSKAFNN